MSADSADHLNSYTATLPDVIASLTLNASMVQKDFSAENFSQQVAFPPLVASGPRRWPRESLHGRTPQGLGALPQKAPVINSGDIPTHYLSHLGYTMSKKEGLLHCQNEEKFANPAECEYQPHFMESKPISPYTNQTTLCQTLQKKSNKDLSKVKLFAKKRSMSSEPRSLHSVQERRTRCSSATRSRQPNSDFTVYEPPERLEEPVFAKVHLTQTQYEAVSQELPTSWSNTGDTKVLYEQKDFQQPSYTNENYKTTYPSNDSNSNNGRAYGYKVTDLEALLTQASSSRPANLPMVLISSTRLHSMRHTTSNIQQGTHTVRPFLSFGIIVNAVFKTRDWLYIRTAHGVEGYVPYRVCLPLGILPVNGPNNHSDPTVLDSPCSSYSQQQPSHVNYSESFAVTDSSNHCITDDRQQIRGRSRTKKKPLLNSTLNQTDFQKLHPSVALAATAAVRSLSQNRQLRETLDSSPNSNHVIV